MNGGFGQGGALFFVVIGLAIALGVAGGLSLGLYDLARLFF